MTVSGDQITVFDECRNDFNETVRSVKEANRFVFVLVSFRRTKAGERARRSIERAHYKSAKTRSRLRGKTQFQTRERIEIPKSCILQARVIGTNNEIWLRYPIRGDFEAAWSRNPMGTNVGALVPASALVRFELYEGLSQ